MRVRTSCGPSDAKREEQCKRWAGQRNLARLRQDGHRSTSVSYSVPALRTAEPVVASSKILLLDLALELPALPDQLLRTVAPRLLASLDRGPPQRPVFTQLQPAEDSSPLKIGRISGCAEGDLAGPRSATGQESAALLLRRLGRSSNVRTHAICTCMGHHFHH